MSEHGKIEIKLGYDVSKVIDAMAAMQRAFAQNAGDVSSHFARLEEHRRQQLWATDPLGLMDWLELDQWRWLLVNRIGNIQDGLSAIAAWIEPD